MPSGNQRRAQQAPNYTSSGSMSSGPYLGKAEQMEPEGQYPWIAPLLATRHTNPTPQPNKPMSQEWDPNDNPVDTYTEPTAPTPYPMDQNPISLPERPKDKRPLPWYSLLMNQ